MIEDLAGTVMAAMLLSLFVDVFWAAVRLPRWIYRALNWAMTARRAPAGSR